MEKYRTFWQAMAFMVLCAWVAWLAVEHLDTAALYIAGVGGGLTGIKWGRSMEHRAANCKPGTEAQGV